MLNNLIPIFQEIVLHIFLNSFNEDKFISHFDDKSLSL